MWTLFVIAPCCDGTVTLMVMTCSPGGNCSAEQVTTPFDWLQFHPGAVTLPNVAPVGRVSVTTSPSALSFARSSATTS